VVQSYLYLKENGEEKREREREGEEGGKRKCEKV